jgi:DNA-binding transcriptional MerR regulator
MSKNKKKNAAAAAAATTTVNNSGTAARLAAMAKLKAQQEELQKQLAELREAEKKEKEEVSQALADAFADLPEKLGLPDLTAVYSALGAHLRALEGGHGRGRRTIPEEVKAKCLELRKATPERGATPISELAKKFGVSYVTIRNWEMKAKAVAKEFEEAMERAEAKTKELYETS